MKTLHVLNVLLTILHFAIIGFNLFGWVWKSTQKGHLILILATAASWLLLGIWYGIGYCPVTDWQWQVKTKLGEQNLPSSFIQYYAEKMVGQPIPNKLIDMITLICFLSALLCAVFVNFLKPHLTKRKKINTV